MKKKITYIHNSSRVLWNGMLENAYNKYVSRTNTSFIKKTRKGTGTALKFKLISVIFSGLYFIKDFLGKGNYCLIWNICKKNNCHDFVIHANVNGTTRTPYNNIKQIKLNYNANIIRKLRDVVVHMMGTLLKLPYLSSNLLIPLSLQKLK